MTDFDKTDEQHPPFDVAAIIERAKEALSIKTDSKLAQHLGVSRATVSNWQARNSIDLQLLLSKMRQVDFNWLLLGPSQSDVAEVVAESYDSETVQLLHHPKTPEPLDQRGVKLFEINAAANLRTVLTDNTQYEVGTIHIPGIPRCDGALYASGDSMYPLIKSGDIVGFRMINSFSSLIYGEIYLVSFTRDGDEYLVVKYVNRSEEKDCIKLVSYNQHHGPMDLPMSCVNALALVKFSVRRYQMW